MAQEDYRDSHQQRGGTYDETISSSPFDWYMDKWEGRHLLSMLPRLFPSQIPRYLDFACGTGRITQRLEPYAVDACGVDVSDTMLSAARNKCSRTRFVKADLTKSEVEPGPFDLVTSFRFFGNAQDDLRDAALAAISRRLRPSGYFVLNNHRNPRSLGAMAASAAGVRHGMDLTHAKLQKLLERHSLEIIDVKPIGFWIFRAKLMDARVLESRYTETLEKMFAHRSFASLAPDAIIVARRTQSA